MRSIESADDAAVRSRVGLNPGSLRINWLRIIERRVTARSKVSASLAIERRA